VQLRKADKQIFEECEIFKRVLLELDAEASGNSSLVEEHFLDPETHLASFATLKERVQKQWVGLLGTRMQEKYHHDELRDRYEASLQRLDQAKTKENELKVTKADLMAELKKVDKVEAERDQLTRREVELNEAVSVARKRVRELELQRKAHQERQQRQAVGHQGRWPSGPNSLSPEGSPYIGSAREPEAFTITAGQGDSWVRQPRWDGCRRTVQSCVVM
jgi:hypothetical protein